MKKKTQTPTDIQSSNDNLDRSPVIPQRSKLKSVLKIFKRELTDRQKQFLALASDKNAKIIFVSGPAGTAKAQPLDTDILGEHGWIKMKDIFPGTLIFGEDGNLHNVISIHPQGMKDIYKISFSDGTSTECTLDHLWKTQTSKDRNSRRWTKTINGKRHREWDIPKDGSVKTTEEMLNTLYVRNGTRVNHNIPITSPIKFNRQSHFISPYIMGILLGDGCFRRNSYVSFTSNDLEIINKIKNELPEKMEVHFLSRYDYSIVHSNKFDSIDGNKIKLEIQRLNLDGLYSYQKYIPNEYLIDSINNRLELLRGLMDSDGTVSRRGYEVSFSTTSPKLSQNVRFLVESLGGICIINEHNSYYTYKGNKIQGLNVYRISICMPESMNPFFLPRKVNRVCPKSKYKPTRYIVNIEKIGMKECQCILLDNPSHLYLTNNCIVTHNTYLSIFHALTMINEKRVSDLIYVRTTVECSDKSVGFLPGIISDKLSPYLQPLMDKLAELLPKNDIELLQKENRISGVPIGFLRGLNWNAKVIVLDEAQNCTFKELFTFITRIGQFSKVFVIGDPGQSDINGKSGFEKMMVCFNDAESQQNGIYTFQFTEEDIVRSELVKFIAKKLRGRI